MCASVLVCVSVRVQFPLAVTLEVWDVTEEGEVHWQQQEQCAVDSLITPKHPGCALKEMTGPFTANSTALAEGRRHKHQ